MSRELTLPVEFLTTAQIGEKGRLSLPSEYREALHLEKGSRVAVLRLGEALLFIPEHTYFRQLSDRIAGIFSNLGIDENEILSGLPSARQRVFERRYPQLVEVRKKKRQNKVKKTRSR